jgi:hypothetical protein
MTLKGRWQYIFYFALLVYLLILQIRAIWPFTIDDMYITLRYAHHWASGLGLLWNPNSVPVEGYSNFTYVVLAAVAFLLHLDPVVTLKITGWFGLVITCVFVYLITRLWFSKKESLIPAIWLLLYKGQIIWAVSGLETAVYEALITGSVYFCYRGMGYMSYPIAKSKNNNWCFFLAGVFLSIAALTRPEAPVFMLVFGLLLAWEQPQFFSASSIRSVISFTLPIVVLFFPYFVWRWNYFGQLFPNPVYCKGFDGNRFALDFNYLKLVWPFVLLSFPACINSSDKRHYFLWIPSVAYLLMLIGADTLVAFQNRLFIPAFALVLILAFQGISNILNSYGINKEMATNYLFIIGILIALLFIPKMSLGDYQYFSEAPLKGEKLRLEVVKWLNIHAKKDDTVVLADSGLIPYYSQLHFIDSYCLNNAEMTKIPSLSRYEAFCNSIMAQQPDYFILTSLIENGEVNYTPSDFCLKKILKNNKNYKLINVISTQSPQSQYRYELFVKF